MFISKADGIKLNYLARGDGAAAIEQLAELVYDFYAKEALRTDDAESTRNKGVAVFAEWLRTLPKALNDMHEVKHGGQ